MEEVSVKPDGPGKEHCYDLMRYHVPFKIADIFKAYRGKPHCCMCGCTGTYYDNGHASEQKIRYIYNKMVKHADQGIEVIEDYIYTIVIGKTQYTIYLHD